MSKLHDKLITLQASRDVDQDIASTTSHELRSRFSLPSEPLAAAMSFEEFVCGEALNGRCGRNTATASVDCRGASITKTPIAAVAKGNGGRDAFRPVIAFTNLILLEAF